MRLNGNADDGVRVEVVRYAINEPVFMSISEFRNSVKVTDEVVPITKRGKICFYKGYLYISSPDKASISWITGIRHLPDSGLCRVDR